MDYMKVLKKIEFLLKNKKKLAIGLIAIIILFQIF